MYGVKPYLLLVLPTEMLSSKKESSPYALLVCGYKAFSALTLIAKAQTRIATIASIKIIFYFILTNSSVDVTIYT